MKVSSEILVEVKVTYTGPNLLTRNQLHWLQHEMEKKAKEVEKTLHLIKFEEETE